MEFPFDLSFLKGNVQGITICDGKFARQLSMEAIPHYNHILDDMGKASCTAQGLGQAVTASYLLRGTDHKIYLLHDGQHRVKALLKIGTKKLFIHGPDHRYIEMKPLCLLDFYVEESCQRKGVGRYIFEWMVRAEGTEPRHIAYDAPSPKLLAFLDKHYGLKLFLPQNCNFVVFDDHFVITDRYHFDPMDLDQPPPSASPPPEVAVTADLEEQKMSDDPGPKQRDQSARTAVQYPAPIQMEHPEMTKKTETALSEPTMDSKPMESAKPFAPGKDPQRVLDSEPMSVLPAASGPDVHEKQLDWIAQQIEKTKKEIADSETRIYQHHLQNKVSPYGPDSVRDSKSLELKRFKNMHRRGF